jgi:hypothetical protein
MHSIKRENKTNFKSQSHDLVKGANLIVGIFFFSEKAEHLTHFALRKKEP